MINKNKAVYIAFLVFAAAFALIVLKGLAVPQPGDENAYYYMGKLVSEGKMPYKNFFYAHPPLHIYLLALFYLIFGFNIIALKMIPLISTLITAFFIFKIARHKFGNAAAVLSPLLFLSSYSIMFNSVFSFGIDVATMLLVIGAYFLWNKNSHILAGFFFGAAAITRLLSMIPVFIILVFALVSNKKNSIKLLLAFLAVFLLVNGLFVFLSGKEYLTEAYAFHFMKKPGIGENIREYLDMAKLNWLLFASAFLFVFVKDKKPAGIFALISIAYLAFLFSLKKIFGFYFLIAMPFLALAAGCSIAEIFRRLNLQRKWKIIASAALLSIFVWNFSSDVMFLEKVGFKGFERGGDIRDFIASNSDADTLLFGDNSAVPLLALMTKKRIAFDVVDTNEQVFLSGLADLNKILAKLKGSNVMFIARSTQGISSFSEAREFLNKNCDLLSSFHDKLEGNYLVYRCR